MIFNIFFFPIMPIHKFVRFYNFDFLQFFHLKSVKSVNYPTKLPYSATANGCRIVQRCIILYLPELKARPGPSIYGDASRSSSTSLRAGKKNGRVLPRSDVQHCMHCSASATGHCSGSAVHSHRQCRQTDHPCWQLFYSHPVYNFLSILGLYFNNCTHFIACSPRLFF
jgi:hypothetical protein